jgi:hypothetical protein
MLMDIQPLAAHCDGYIPDPVSTQTLPGLIGRCPSMNEVAQP